MRVSLLDFLSSLAGCKYLFRVVSLNRSNVNPLARRPLCPLLSQCEIKMDPVYLFNAHFFIIIVHHSLVYVILGKYFSKM